MQQNHFFFLEVGITSIDIKSAILWNMTPCSQLKVNRRFGGTYRLYLQGQIISRARNQLAI
jgi:hypothetical protein